MNDLTIAKIKKDDGTEIRITLNSYKNKLYCHIREYFKSSNDEYLPSKKGISFNVNTIKPLFNAISKHKSVILQKFSEENTKPELVKKQTKEEKEIADLKAKLAKLEGKKKPVKKKVVDESIKERKEAIESLQSKDDDEISQEEWDKLNCLPPKDQKDVIDNEFAERMKKEQENDSLDEYLQKK